MFYFPLTVLLGFQNCSDADFATEASHVNKLLGSDLVLENGFDYTNKKIIDIQLKVNTSIYKAMRISDSPNFENSISQPTQENFKFDLGDNYAPDGSKDGIKSIYVELTGEGIPVKIINQNIGLDTVHPKINAEGILASGLEGVIYSHQETVSIDWSGTDVMSSTGFNSGIDEVNGLKVAYSAVSDCSTSQVSVIKDWGTYTNGTTVSWPQKSPLDSLYFCIYLKDRAGNLNHVMSQPMTSLWKVIVGENSQGNGSDYLAPNIRFKKPGNLAKDALGNIYIQDEHFNNIRVISSAQSQTPNQVSLFAGNGQLAPTGNGDSIANTYRGYMNGMIFDESKNSAVYSSSIDGIFYAKLNENRTRANIQKISNVKRSKLAERNYKGKRTLLIYTIQKIIGDDASAGSYLFEIPWEDLDKISKVLTLEDLAKYRIAGNGIVALSSVVIPEKIKIPANTISSDPVLTLDLPSAITTDSLGNIYLGSTADGAARGWGRHLIRKLSPLDGGGFEQTLLGNGGWSYQMLVYEGQLYISTSTGLRVIDINTKKVSTPLPELNGQYIRGLLMDMVNGKPRFYISESYRSQVGVYDSNFKLEYRIGREVYKETESNALTAIIGQSDGVVEDPNGNIYYIDSINHVIRKVDALTGGISTIAGKKDVAIGIEPSNLPLKDFTFSGRDATANYHNKSLVGNFDGDNEILYMSTGFYGSVIALDLKNKVANTVVGRSMENIDEADNFGNDKYYYGYRIFSFAYDKYEKSLYTSRTYAAATPLEKHKGFSGFISKTNVDGIKVVDEESHYAGDLDKGKEYMASIGNSTEAIDSKNMGFYLNYSMKASEDGLMYSMGAREFSVQNLVENTTKKIEFDKPFAKVLGAFEVFSEGDIDHVVVSSGQTLKYFKINRKNALDPQKKVVAQVSTLCLPGTFLNRARYLSKGVNNNLIISDTNSGRILRYYISSEDSFKFTSCN